jgi:cytoskeletal protein CcmA (bactofilin family)
VIVAGSLKGNIVTEKLEIRSTGRVWGDVVTTTFSTEEGAFLRGQVRMEETLDLNIEEPTGEDEKPESPEEEGEPKKPPLNRTRKVA